MDAMTVSPSNGSLSNGYAAAPQPVDDDLGLSHIIGSFRRRRWTFAAVVAGILVATAVVLVFLTPRYAGEVLVMIEDQKAEKTLSIENVVAGLTGDPESVQSEVHVLGSRALATRVVRKLGLDKDPEFAADDDSLSPDEAEATVVDNYMDWLTVEGLEKSRVISVRFASEDPEKAAHITNTIANEYLNWRLENKFQLTAQTNTWLTQRIAELRKDVGETEEAVEMTRANLGLLESKDGETLVAQEMGELNTQLVVAAAARAEAE